MIKTLNFFERVYIFKKGHYDAKNKLFLDINTGNVVEDSNSGEFYKKYSDPDVNNGDQYLMAVSHFLLTESQRYVSIRNHYLAFKLCTYQIYADNFDKKRKISSISKAIPKLSAQIKWFEAYCENFEEKANAEIAKYKEILDEYEKKNYPHKVKAYEQKQAACSKCLSEQLAKANQIIEILKNERERLIRQAQMQLLSIRSKRYLRLRYYYEVANRVNPNIPLLSIAEENLSGVQIFDDVLDFEVLNKDILRYIDEV